MTCFCSLDSAIWSAAWLPSTCCDAGLAGKMPYMMIGLHAIVMCFAGFLLLGSMFASGIAYLVKQLIVVHSWTGSFSFWRKREVGQPWPLCLGLIRRFPIPFHGFFVPVNLWPYLCLGASSLQPWGISEGIWRVDLPVQASGYADCCLQVNRLQHLYLSVQITVTPHYSQIQESKKNTSIIVLAKIVWISSFGLETQTGNDGVEAQRK